MESKELRIGNYLKLDCESNHHKKDFFQVVPRDIEVIHKKIVDYKDYEPIPLNEEWLLKFGFEKIGSNFNLLGFSVWWNFKKEIYQILLRNGEKVDLLFVHQLQNLYFALTGSELNFMT